MDQTTGGGNEMDATLPPVVIPSNTPWYARLVLDNWTRIRQRLLAFLALVAIAAQVAYQHADVVKGLVSDETFHHLGVVYMLLMWWNIIRNNRTGGS